MIVLLDIETQKLRLYKDDGMVEIPFVNASQLLDYLDGEDVYYVTDAIEVNANEIINVIKQMGVVVQDEIPVDGSVRYLHGVSEGTIFISKDLKFEGKFDCKLLDDRLAQAIQHTPLLQKLIRHKKIEIIGEARRRKLMREFKNTEVKRVEKQKQIDAELDKMILKTKVEDYEGISDDDHLDAVEIDLMSRTPVLDSGGVGTMSELLDNIDGLE